MHQIVLERVFKKIKGDKLREKFYLHKLLCKSQGIYVFQTQFEIIIGTLPINDLVAHVKAV